MNPQIVKAGFLDMQVCVPADWPDEQVQSYANTENPAGTQNGWFVRKQGSELLAGCDARVPCSEHQGKVHIMLDC